MRHLRSLSTAYAAVYFVCAMTAFVGLTFSAWGPSFFVRTFSMKPMTVGLLLGPVSALSGVLGCLVSGTISDRLVALGWRGGRFLVPLLWWPIALVSMIALALAPSYQIALAAIGFLNFGSGIGLASVPPVIQDITPNRFRGRAVSLHFIFSGLLGMGLAPTLIALVTDHVFQDPTALRSSLLVVLIPVVIVGFVVGLISLGAYEQARQRIVR